MIRMLDTNICIYIMNNKPEVVAKKLAGFQVGEIAVSSIVLSELAFGVHKSQKSDSNLYSPRRRSYIRFAHYF